MTNNLNLNQIETILRQHPLIQAVAIVSAKTKNIGYILPKRWGQTAELKVSWGEYQLFDPLTYASMTQDTFRNAQYKNAINQHVRDKTVVDIGTGQDIVLTKMCIEAGAKKVYALEMDEAAYHQAKAKVQQLGWQEQVTVIHGDSMTIELPEKVDVCVSEIIGSIGSSEGVVAILNNARRFLHDDGIMIPSQCETKIAAVYLPPDLSHHPTMNTIEAYYIEKIFAQRGHPLDVRLVVTNFPQSNIVSNESIFENLFFSKPLPTTYKHEITLIMTQQAKIDGFLLWLNLYTDRTSDVINPLTQKSNWGPIYFPVFYPGVAVNAGDTIAAVCEVTLSEDGVRPDYRIQGELQRQNKEPLQFSYESNLYKQPFRHNPFYQQLFSGPNQTLNISSPQTVPLSVEQLENFLQPYRTDSMEFVISENLPLAPTGDLDHEQVKRLEQLSLTRLFTHQVEQTPNNIAVVYQTQQLTYSELNHRANQVAHQLQQLGVTANTFVGLSVKPSLEMVIGLMGILKAGGAFVPLDPTYPIDRLNHLVQDSGLTFIVTMRNEAPSLTQEVGLVYLDDPLLSNLPRANPTASISAYQLACCLYTSGSTGQPKGVLIEHQAIAAHCLAMLPVYNYTVADRVLLFASLNYVAALEPLFMVLLSGARLVLREPELWAGLTFPAKVKSYGLTVVDLSPEYWHALLESWQSCPDDLTDLPLRLVILGGDAMRPETVKLWQQCPLCKSARLLNAYGMTETPITATIFEKTEKGQFTRVPIGQAVPNRLTMLLDEEHQPMPPGAVGELCIGGASLARGYLNQPELTAAKFISNPFGAGRLYKTGDLARQLADGTLEYVGRKDQQVQLRGHRIELGEIEATLKGHIAVKDAAVVAQGEGIHQRLVAYVVPPTEQSIWQPQEHYRHEKGVLTHHTERLVFKLRQVNIQSFDAGEIPLMMPQVNETLQQIYLARQSYRHFQPEIIPFESFCQFLSCFMSLNLPDTPLPKYRYPSAGGLYPVQTYLYCKPGRIENIDAGYYYYQPHEHKLQRVCLDKEIPPHLYTSFDQHTYEQAAFAIFFVGHLEAVAPMYGQKLAHEFCLLEAGYMGQLLMTQAPTYNLGLCPLDLTAPQIIKEQLKLGEDKILAHSFLGGGITPAQTKTWLQPTTTQKSPAELKTEWQKHLQEKLPPHMMPEQFVILEQLPLTPNGKVDRQALPKPESPTIEWIAPRTPTEQILVDLWQKLLNIPHIGVEAKFFEIGGNSLLTLQLLNEIEQLFQVELPLSIIFQKNTIAQLVQHIESLQNQSQTPESLAQAGVKIRGHRIELGENQSDIPATFWQERFLSYEKYNPHYMFNVVDGLYLTGRLDIEVFRRSFNELIRRHEILRTSFLMKNNSWVQMIADHSEINLSVTDLCHLPQSKQQDEIDFRIREERFRHPFDPAESPLMRVTLMRLQEESHLMILNVNHVIIDAWSFNIIYREIGIIYDSLLSGKPLLLPVLNKQYSDYASNRKTFFNRDILQTRLDYWKAWLEKPPVTLNFKTDTPRPADERFTAKRRGYRFSSELTRQIKTLSRKADATVFMTIVSSLGMLAYQYSGCRDIIIASTFSDRNLNEFENVIGLFGDMMLLRVDLNGNPDIYELLKQTRKMMISAIENQDLPFDQAFQFLLPEYDRNAILHRILISFFPKAPELSSFKLKDIDIYPLEVKDSLLRPDLALFMWEGNENNSSETFLSGSLVYRTELFKDETIDNMMRNFEYLLDTMSANPDQCVDDIITPISTML